MTASVKSRGMPATEGLGCPLAKGLSDFSLYGDDVILPAKGPCNAVLELGGYAYVSASSLGSIDHHQALLFSARTMVTYNPRLSKAFWHCCERHNLVWRMGAAG